MVHASVSIVHYSFSRMQFTASVVPGAGRGTTIGSPTLNLDLDDVPPALEEGIHAAWAFVDDRRHPAALFFGPRPVFDDARACEVYLISGPPDRTPETLTVRVIGFLRPVEDFDSVEELQDQIAVDVAKARAMLAADDSANHESADS